MTTEATSPPGPRSPVAGPSPTPDPPIKAILPYLGGKRRMAGMICDLMQARGVRQYVEPYHGSLAVLLELRRRGFDGVAIANDLEALVANLALCLTTPWFDALAAKIEALPFHEAVYRDAIELLVEETKPGNLRATRGPSPVLAAAYLVASWMGPNGEAGSDRDWEELRGRFCVRWTTTGGDPAQRWRSVIESLPGWRDLLRSKTTFTQRDALAVIPEIPDEPGVVIYCDPPYLLETRGEVRYRVDVDDSTGGFREEDDHHAQLAAALHRFEKATVIVSYYAHERLKRLYPEARWEHIDCAQNKASAQTQKGAAKKVSPEVVIVSRE